MGNEKKRSDRKAVGTVHYKEPSLSKHVPIGWDKWFALVRNSKFYNYTVNDNGIARKFGNDYEKVDDC